LNYFGLPIFLGAAEYIDYYLENPSSNLLSSLGSYFYCISYSTQLVMTVSLFAGSNLPTDYDLLMFLPFSLGIPPA